MLTERDAEKNVLQSSTGSIITYGSGLAGLDIGIGDLIEFEATNKLSVLERTQKLSEVLAPLNGRQREVMEAILKNVTTDQLDEGYKTFIGRVLKEDAEPEDKDNMINENTKVKKRKLPENVVIKSGDNVEKLEESVSQLSEDAKLELRKLAGML